jgi:hypothetical protein
MRSRRCHLARGCGARNPAAPLSFRIRNGLVQMRGFAMTGPPPAVPASPDVASMRRSKYDNPLSRKNRAKCRDFGGDGGCNHHCRLQREKP